MDTSSRAIIAGTVQVWRCRAGWRQKFFAAFIGGMVLGSSTRYHRSFLFEFMESEGPMAVAKNQNGTVNQ